MSRIFKYSLLQYHHSLSLGEKLNIGVILLFPIHQKVFFLYPERLNRAKAAYPDLPEKTLKAYLKGITNRVNEISEKPEVFTDFRIDEDVAEFVNREILVADSSSLRFGEVRTSVQVTEDINLIKEQVYERYLSLYHLDDEQRQPHNEEYLARVFRKSLLKKHKEAERLFREEKIQENVVVKVGGTVLNFEYGWQNGAYNLVKPVSFDLKRGDSIQKKAIQYFGQTELLQDQAKVNNYQFDYLVARPSQRSLFKAYDNAIALLQKPARVNIIEESDIDRYSQKALDYLLR